MNNKSAIDDIPKEMLPAVRMMLLDTINSGLLTSAAVTEVKAMISYIESKMKDNGVSLNTSVSSYDMEKAQKYMGGFSGINNNNYYNNNSDDDIIGNFFAGFVGVLIVLGLIVTILKWIGNAISYLWTSGIIPMILGAIGLGVAGFGIYKLYENGFFDKVKEYLENKKKEKAKKKKQEKSVKKVKTAEKTTSKSTEEEKEDKYDKAWKVIKSLYATYAALLVLGTAGYHIVDKSEFNGKKISLGYYGRTNDQQYKPLYEFNPNLQVLLNSRSSKDIMYDVPEERSWFDPNNYSLANWNLIPIVADNIGDVNQYIATGNFNGDAYYYHIDKTLSPFLDTYDTELVEMFMDYRNAIVYYAANNMREELGRTLDAFYTDCYLMFLREKTYQLGNPFGMHSYKFSEASPLAKVAVLQICKYLLEIDYYKTPSVDYFPNNSIIGYSVNFQDLKDFVERELSYAKNQNRNKEYIKHYWLYNE